MLEKSAGWPKKKITAVMTQDGCCHVYLICKHDQVDLNK